MTAFWHSALAYISFLFFFLCAWITAKSMDKAARWEKQAKESAATANNFAELYKKAQQSADLWEKNYRDTFSKLTAAQVEIERVKNGVKIYKNRVTLSRFMLNSARDPEAIRENALREIRRNLAQGLAGMIKIEAVELPHDPHNEHYDAYIKFYANEEGPTP